MKAKELIGSHYGYNKEDIYNKLVSLNYSRKENYLSEVNSIDYNSLDSELKEVIESNAIAWSVASIEVEEIDSINILKASFKAMHTAIAQLKVDLQAGGVKLK